MKRCPSCNLNYSDETLEFCLHDGSRLIPSVKTKNQMPTVTLPINPVIATEKTNQLPFSNQVGAVGVKGAESIQTSLQADLLTEKVFGQTSRILDLAPVVISLAHNWWQWIYLNNQYYSSFWVYVFSANFLMWLLLLVVGTAISLLALKRSSNKAFAIISLVILAVNLLLFLVPKR